MCLFRSISVSANFPSFFTHILTAIVYIKLLSFAFGALSRIFIATLSGKNRYNVLVIIDAITHNFVSVSNTTYINHLSVIELLEKIREIHKNSVIPISIFFYNAKHQLYKIVIEKAVTLNIKLIFLSPYSPNLNLIERLWKWVKKDCHNCKYYSRFCEF